MWQVIQNFWELRRKFREHKGTIANLDHISEVVERLFLCAMVRVIFEGLHDARRVNFKMIRLQNKLLNVAEHPEGRHSVT